MHVNTYVDVYKHYSRIRDTCNSRLLPGSSVPLVAFKQLKFCFYYNFSYRVGW